MNRKTVVLAAFLAGSFLACGTEDSPDTGHGGTADAGAQTNNGGSPVGSGGAPLGLGGTLPQGGNISTAGGAPTHLGGTSGTGASAGGPVGGASIGGASVGGVPITSGGGDGWGGTSTGGHNQGGTGPAAGSPAEAGAMAIPLGGSGNGGVPNVGGEMTAGRAEGGSAGGGGDGGLEQGGNGTGGLDTGGRPQVIAAPGTTLVTIDPSLVHQTFEGWGTSLCWWANRIGGWSSENRDRFLDMIVNPTTGLGYNIFRYNIGGGENPAHDHMGDFRDMPGLQPTEGTWDWDADARQTAVLSRLVDVGQDVILEAFSNSPPYWMTKSGCASGSSDGSNNLEDDAYDRFAGFLTDVVQHYRDELGITFRTLEPMNEPNANWWKAEGSQEGCHFDRSAQERIIQAVGAHLATKGLTETQLSASDENSMDDAYSIMGQYSATTLDFMAQMNVHSYAGSRRAELRELAESRGKRLWQSESGPLGVTLDSNTDAALFMAERIITDLRQLQPNAWLDWQTVDPANSWTSFTIDDNAQTGTPEKRFYMHAGFSRYIRPGATFVDIDDDNMVAAVANDGSTLTVVVRNGDESNPASYTFDLTRLANVGSSVEVYRTSASEDLVELSPLEIQDWSFTADCPSYSVTTYVIRLRD